MKNIRKMFITGLLVLIPIVVTVSLIGWVFNKIDSIFRIPLEKIIGFPLIGVGVVLNLIIITITGFFATNYLGKQIICFVEKTLTKIPLVNTIYISVKQLIDTLFLKQRDAFKSAVLVQYPSKGIYTIGFITGDTSSEISSTLNQDMKSIFIPTTPNPTSGMLVMIPKNDIIMLDISIEAALKLVVSGGILLPDKGKK
ncbi:DUF502 domain-containing protein [Inediibacterium massiliense]|uniref:DUF502 domain-containing protein n=1 Tax=Inediibacterium massiliense TaxID=1658111 RepID=UPI0018FE6C55|nr:DUF502 domain-containing protein [Inediibacterium massiliense]